jgi:putative tryptophan/tyrosine transport system substrate-binding protein
MTIRRRFPVACGWRLQSKQQNPKGRTERVRRVGILQGLAESDLEGRRNVAAFYQGLQQLGWSDGRNVQFDERWGAGDADRIRKFAAELAGPVPEVILAIGPDSLAQLLGVTRTIPLVFILVPDPVGAGFVDRSYA